MPNNKQPGTNGDAFWGWIVFFFLRAQAEGLQKSGLVVSAPRADAAPPRVQAEAGAPLPADHAALHAVHNDLVGRRVHASMRFQIVNYCLHRSMRNLFFLTGNARVFGKNVHNRVLNITINSIFNRYHCKFEGILRCHCKTGLTHYKWERTIIIHSLLIFFLIIKHRWYFPATPKHLLIKSSETLGGLVCVDNPLYTKKKPLYIYLITSQAGFQLTLKSVFIVILGGGPIYQCTITVTRTNKTSNYRLLYSFHFSYKRKEREGWYRPVNFKM